VYVENEYVIIRQTLSERKLDYTII